MNHTSLTLSFLDECHQIASGKVLLNGSNLSIPTLYTICKQSNVKIGIDQNCVENVKRNSEYLLSKIEDGAVVYGVNTGYGGSADVRSNDRKGVQVALIKHLNAGLGSVFNPEIPRAVMAVRANSLCRGMSGCRLEVIQMLVDMLNHNIVPEVPLRGSVSASGDLMPTSYIAAAMMGREDLNVNLNNHKYLVRDALRRVGLTPIVFRDKEALAVVNSCSFSASLSAKVLYEANKACLLTQLAIALSTEALHGHRESFHPTISAVCLPHPGHTEVASNVWNMLDGSKFAITKLEVENKDHPLTLKQDRYALRTSAQWLAPVLETLVEAVRRVDIELNSTGDNPIIDHQNDRILHCGNFQGTSITVAMDQTRQAIQLCGRVLFAQLSEILNVQLSNGLPPNLSGSNTAIDFGYKATDIAMASYMSELDWLTSPVTNHVLSAEMHNQSINSLALISARRSEEALEILMMMLANIFNAHVQAIDLRFLQNKVLEQLDIICDCYSIKRSLMISIRPWYELAFTPEVALPLILDALDYQAEYTTIVAHLKNNMVLLMEKMHSGFFTKEIAARLGNGTAKMYRFLRQKIGLKFYHADRVLDKDLQKILETLKSQHLDSLLKDIFHPHCFDIKENIVQLSAKL